MKRRSFLGWVSASVISAKPILQELVKEPAPEKKLPSSDKRILKPLTGKSVSGSMQLYGVEEESSYILGKGVIADMKTTQLQLNKRESDFTSALKFYKDKR